MLPRAHRFHIAAAIATLVASCSNPAPPVDAMSERDAMDVVAEDATLPPSDIVDTTVADILQPPPITRTQTERQLAPQRQACAFAAGAWPADTIGTDYPLGSDIPINHVVVIMQENRSFDHYLGRLVAQGYYQPGDFTTPPDGGADSGPGSGFSHSDQVDVPPPGWSNSDSDGTVVVPHLDNEYCFTANHGWDDMHDDWDNGLNDHFVTNNDPDGQRSMSYEDDSVIPFYYALANTFSLGDQYHCSVLSSTWPNRYFVMAATSFGIGDNSYCTVDTPTHQVNQIFSELEAGGHTWMDYTDGPHEESFFLYFGFRRADTFSHYGTAQCDLMRDIANGTLPDVSFVMGDEAPGAFSDEGPSSLAQIGGQWVEGIMRALFASPSWSDTAVFIVYDENGGMADHVPPAPACVPDSYTPHDGSGNPLSGAFDHNGFRVPFIVVSPYARAHYVSHVVYDHTSITRFIEARFGLPAMTARDANAAVPMDMFDFAHPPFVTPPSIPAHTNVDPTILSSCHQVLPTLGCGADE